MLYFENARKCFEKAYTDSEERVALSSFYHGIARMVPDKVDVDTLLLVFKIALQDAEKNGINTTPFISLIPNFVRQFTSLEFAHEFRKKYISQVLGIYQEELPDVDYGCVEVAPDVIDISNKDRAEVLAALYNASIPVGRGFMQYNPMKWNKEIAEAYIMKYGEYIDGEILYFKWILGRLTPCRFEGNLVYVAQYNYENEPGLAQRVIATVPNIDKKYINKY